jgi:mannosyltransferase OCH1-like enzyme
MHPDWEWVLWTDEDNAELVERFAPGMKGAYDELGKRGPIFRADIVRNGYLFLFGG